mmetsp:Transcript_21796/g.49627  ORF Transcript_21796/g.49627 Transcript_21796/m.49627 type:complete len:260 (+) Transcript_21796:149-928(+)
MRSRFDSSSNKSGDMSPSFTSSLSSFCNSLIFLSLSPSTPSTIPAFRASSKLQMKGPGLSTFPCSEGFEYSSRSAVSRKSAFSFVAGFFSTGAGVSFTTPLAAFCNSSSASAFVSCSLSLILLVQKYFCPSSQHSMHFCQASSLKWHLASLDHSTAVWCPATSTAFQMSLACLYSAKASSYFLFLNLALPSFLRDTARSPCSNKWCIRFAVLSNFGPTSGSRRHGDICTSLRKDSKGVMPLPRFALRVIPSVCVGSTPF